MDLGLQGRTALVTGGSKGIGLATAEALADEGCNLVLVSRTAEDLAATRDRISQSAGVQVKAEALDIANPASVVRLVAAHPNIDILVNNAGAIPAGRLDEISVDRWRDAWELKVFGYIDMTRAFYAAMKARRGGVIVNIIGSAGERLESDYIAGSAGNASLIAFTRALGSTSAWDNVRVVGINPGPVDTERLQTIMKKRAQNRLGDATRWREMYAPLPFGRAGKPKEIADMVAFLASDRSAYTTGTIITIDGGASSRGINS